jgi:hypothetical protein
MLHDVRGPGIVGMLVAGLLAGLPAAGEAQSAFRMRGQAQEDSGRGVPVSVELEAVYGFRGLEFVGQKTFTARANDKGQWSVLGVTSGAWIFAAHAPCTCRRCCCGAVHRRTGSARRAARSRGRSAELTRRLCLVPRRTPVRRAPRRGPRPLPPSRDR